LIAITLGHLHKLFNRNVSSRSLSNYLLGNMNVDQKLVAHQVENGPDYFIDESKKQTKKDLVKETKDKDYLISTDSFYNVSKGHTYIQRWLNWEKVVAKDSVASSREIASGKNDNSKPSKINVSKVEPKNEEITEEETEISNFPEPIEGTTLLSEIENKIEEEIKDEIDILDDIILDDGANNIFSGNILPELIDVIGSSKDPKELSYVVFDDKSQDLNEIEISEMLIQTFTAARKSDDDIVIAAGILLAIYDFGTHLSKKTNTTYVGQMERTVLQEIQKNHLTKIRDDVRSKNWWQRLLAI